MNEGRLPLCSSAQVVSALGRLGCYPGKAKSSSHQSFHRRISDGRVVTAPVVLGKKEVPRGTLRSILALLEIPAEQFMGVLR